MDNNRKRLDEGSGDRKGLSEPDDSSVRHGTGRHPHVIMEFDLSDLVNTRGKCGICGDWVEMFEGNIRPG